MEDLMRRCPQKLKYQHEFCSLAYLQESQKAVGWYFIRFIYQLLKAITLQRPKTRKSRRMSPEFFNIEILPQIPIPAKLHINAQQSVCKYG